MTSTAEAATAQSPVAHLTPERWAVANRHLVRKALAEFSHERILVPELIREEADGIGLYKVVSDDGSVEYRFRARVLELEHWSVLPDSIGRHGDGGKLPLDALDFIAEFHQTLGIGMDMLPVYLEEISSTLAGHAYKQGKPFGSVELAAGVTGGSDVAADFQAIEHSMAEGHPCFVANNGRLGFGIEDYHAFAPEAGATVQLQWIAVHRSKAVFTSSAGLDYKAHFEAELGPATVAWFNAGLSASGLDPEDYFFMPVHPWQWDNKLTVTFAAEIAQQHIVHLGHGEDSYQAQQSIRTFFNATSPGKAYVKTAMSVLNMGFMRGLSPQYMKATPAINDWLQELITKDQELQDRGLAMIKESAAIGYRNDYFEAASAKDSPYRKMLSALWRESPLPLLKDGQQLATMASLLHVDASGASMVSSLIARSGLEPTQWLRRYFDAYLVPLVHCLYNYELAFMPHGENVILILEDGVPVRAIMKDIAEEIVVMGDRLELPGKFPASRQRSRPNRWCWQSLRTSSTASSASFPRSSLRTERCAKTSSGGLLHWCCGNTRPATPNSPISSTGTTSSPRTSSCPASTGCSCGTTSTCWISPIPPGASKWRDVWPILWQSSPDPRFVPSP